MKDATSGVGTGGEGCLPGPFFENWKKYPDFGKNILIVFIYGLNFSSKNAVLRESRNHVLQVKCSQKPLLPRQIPGCVTWSGNRDGWVECVKSWNYNTNQIIIIVRIIVPLSLVRNKTPVNEVIMDALLLLFNGNNNIKRWALIKESSLNWILVNCFYRQWRTQRYTKIYDFLCTVYSGNFLHCLYSFRWQFLILKWNLHTAIMAKIPIQKTL